MKLKDEQLQDLKKHVSDITQGLINKPTTQYNLSVTQTAEDYMKTKDGIHLSVMQCLKPKESKKIDLIILNGKHNNFETYNYYNLLCSLVGQKVLIENIIVTDKHRGNVLIKYNNKTEQMTRTKLPFETSYELGKINEYIRDKLETKYKKFIKSNNHYVNQLRLDLVKTNNRLWNDVKNNMTLVCN